MKSFAVINHYKQWKVSYGEHIYWKLGAAWYRLSKDHKSMQLVPIGDKEYQELEVAWFKSIQRYGK